MGIIELELETIIHWNFFPPRLTLGSTGLNQHNITILHRVVLALGHDLSGALDGSFVAVFPQRSIIVNNCLNKSLFKVCVGISIL